MIFSKTELKFCWETSFCQFQTWLLPGLRKMFTPIISNTKWCHSVGYPCNFIGTYVFVFCWQMLLPLSFYQIWLNVIAIYCLPNVGRCYCHLFVVYFKNHLFGCFWADVIALHHLWQMLYHFRCCLWLMFSHLVFVVDVVTTYCFFPWQMLCHVV